MSDTNIPVQMELPFEVVEYPSQIGQVISFAARRDVLLAAKVKDSSLTESEIIKKVLERADRLAWYK